MSTSIRQSNLFAAEDWRKLYTTFRSADFQSYDYETLRKTMVDYLRTYYPEDFNDYIESSEFIALLDLISFMGQSISYRSDLNFRENFLQTAERRDSIYRMASMLGYNPSRNTCASGVLKIVSVNTSETIVDSNGANLSGRTVRWNDPTNANWLEQFVSIINSSLQIDQRVGKPAGSVAIGNIRHDLYEFRTRRNQIPSIDFSASINGTTYPFNIYNAALDEENGVYEKAPRPSSSMGFVYKTDGEGNASPNTGFFMGFKQGSLNTLDFVINESLPNRLVSLNTNNINNKDVWLFGINDAGAIIEEWPKVEQLRDSNVIYNDLSDSKRNLFSVYSRENDQVDLIFGDGVFSNIPVGIFRAIVRNSNGLSYSITPAEMRNINIEIPYVSKELKLEKLKLTLSLQYTVTNAATRESLSEIKLKAPQNFYSQNRLINGEDYNTLPYVKFNSILKVKSVNRTSSGISRFLDLKDVTGKYSSTNVFCEDGYIYKEEDKEKQSFSWNTASDIQNFIINRIGGMIKSKESVNLYYHNYPTKVPPETFWIKGSAEKQTSSGFFVIDPAAENYAVQPIGQFSTNNRKFITRGSLLKFVAPDGFFFDVDRVLVKGTPTLNNQVTELWASVKSILSDGTNNGKGWLNGVEGPGPIVLTENIPSGAILAEIYPVYNTNLDINLTQVITKKIINNEDFAIRYDQDTNSWMIVNPRDIDENSAFSIQNAGNTSGQKLDASWVVLLLNNGLGRYTVYNRRLNFFWGSDIETRFYFDPNNRVYDSRNGTVIKDQIRVLKGNTVPDSNNVFSIDKVFEIYDTVDYSDGYSDDSKIKITYADKDNDGIPDDPTLFKTIVNESENILTKLVFFEKYYDYNSIERYRYIDSKNVVTRYPTESEINKIGKFAFPVGTVFYAYNESKFFQLLIIEDQRVLQKSDNYSVRVGRDKLKFQYRHNSPNDRRIDPSASNIIDMYILTEAYDRDFRRWLADMSGKISMPQKPTQVDMQAAFKDLEKIKSVSDTIFFSPAEYKILFGKKASSELQAVFKVVKAENSQLSNSEIRSRVVEVINRYFSIDNWNFGDTFYFSELAAFIHQELNDNVGSVVIVPRSSTQNFGDLFQISCKPNEIFVNNAKVDDVEIINSVTASQLQNGNQINIFGGYTPIGFRNL